MSNVPNCKTIPVKRWRFFGISVAKEETKMDLKRYEKIDGREALERLANGLEIYGFSGLKYQVDFLISDYKLWSGEKECGNGEDTPTPLTLTEILKETWYVKKPFDVRAEMLARPDEWVGAFRDSKNVWHKIGLDSKYMVAVETRFEEIKPNWNDDRCDMATLGELKKCIPFEDIPEEELT